MEPDNAGSSSQRPLLCKVRTKCIFKDAEKLARCGVLICSTSAARCGGIGGARASYWSLRLFPTANIPTCLPPRGSALFSFPPPVFREGRHRLARLGILSAVFHKGNLRESNVAYFVILELSACIVAPMQRSRRIR